MVERLEDVTAAILAGGLGTRLRARIADRPKVLAPVHGRPYLAYLLEQLAEAGMREAVLLTGYRADQVRATFGAMYAGLRLTYSVEHSPLGTAGALQLALPYLRSSTALILNGDSYCAAPLADFLMFHQRQPADASLVLTPVEDAARYGRVQVGPEGRILRFEEKSSVGGPGWVNAGIYLVNRSLLEEVPAGASMSLERDMLPAWVHSKRCFGFACTARFLDICTPESYAEAEAFFSPDLANDLA